MKQLIIKSLVTAFTTLLSLYVYAYDAYIGGIYYNLNTSNKTATVTYKNTSYNSYSGSVTIPSTISYQSTTYTVKSIGNSAFEGCNNLTSVIMPNSVTSIGSYAFYNCSGMISVSIPNSVMSIGKSAFDGCSGLTSVHITDIEPWCNITYDQGISNPLKYAHHLYLNGTEVKDLVIPNSVTSISGWAFLGWSGLTSVTIPNSVTSIGSYAFCDCSGLTSVTIPNSVTSIGVSAFEGCSHLSSVVIPNSVTSISNYAFESCTSLTSIVSEITTPFTISYYTFVNIPANCVLTVPYGAKDAYIAAGWTEDVFKGGIVEAVPNITFADANVEAICVANWDTNGDGGLSEEEAAAVTDLGTVFKNNTQITSFDELQYFTGLTSIGMGTFYLCNGLRSVIIPNNVTSIDQYGFCDCSSLTSVTFSNNVTSIGDRAFQGCSGLTTISIPNSVTSIGYAAFSGCSSLTTVSIPNNVTSIVTETFDGCSGLTSVSIPNGVTSIGNSAFRDCSGLTSVTIPNSVTTIGGYAFKNCTNLTSVISEIEEPSDFNIYAFQNISSTCTLTVPYGTKDAYFEKGWSESFFKGGIVELDNRNEQSMELASLPAKTYGDAAYTLPATTTQGLALTWSSGNTNVATISGNTLTVKGAGSATITAAQAGNDDYKPFSKEFTLTVAKAPLTITANDATKNVGEENPAFTASYEGFVGDDDATVLTAQPTFTCEATSESPVGTYDINVSGAESANYEITYVKGTLTVVDETPISNILAIADAEGLIGNSTVLPISMSNTESIKGFQFDLRLPAGVTVATDAYGDFVMPLTSRAHSSHSVSARLLTNGDYRVVVSSLSAKNFSGTEGDIMNVTLNVADNVAAGAYEVKLFSIVLNTADNVSITPADVTATLTVSDIEPGDANGDKHINVTDVGMVIDHILDNTPENFIEAAADLNHDGHVNVTDVGLIIDIILSDPASAKKRGEGDKVEMLDPQ